MDSAKYYIANATGSLDDVSETIKQCFQEAAELSHQAINLNRVDVIFVDNPQATIPELGVAGYTANANLIYINLDSRQDVRKSAIISTLSHEFHHAMRWRKTGYGDTLFDALITEGSACFYEKELHGDKPIYTDADTSKSLDLLDWSDFNSKNYNHYELFISGDNKIPRWFGYSLGYLLAEKYAERTGASAKDMIEVKSKEFEKDLRALIG